ncbi:hypothetical protein K438DRAFT_1595868, partial [Mycena galopus ATCC 62051]
SPLFTTLFPELRNIVFIHALTEYDDDHTCPYSKHEYYYRPGFEFAGRIDTNLLLTCRLIYLEMYLAPIALNEHVFWMYHRPPPRSRSFSTDDMHNTYFSRMTPQQRAAVCDVRFFTQLYWLEARKFQDWAVGLAVRKLTIVVRHTDWWHWEDHEPLRISPPQLGWATWVESMPQLEELEFEFKTIEPKREQLEERVWVALGWRFPLGDGTTLVHNGAAPVISTWAGTSRLAPGHGWGAWDTDVKEQDQTRLDRRFPLDLKMNVRKFKFVKESRLL